MSGVGIANGPYQAWLDELVAWAMPESRKAEILPARAAYFEKSGEIFDDDKQFEGRMASFLEHFVFDRPAESGLTPARTYYLQVLTEGPPERAAAFRAFTETIHGLFEVRRLSPGEVRVRDVNSGLDYEITERRTMAGLTKGDVVEARLIPFGGNLWFSTAFVWHPREAVPLILKEAKRRKKKEPHRTGLELVHDCAQRSLKVDRYRNIAIEKIYDFREAAVIRQPAEGTTPS